jgi:hypothetical protein
MNPTRSAYFERASYFDLTTEVPLTNTFCMAYC